MRPQVMTERDELPRAATLFAVERNRVTSILAVSASTSFLAVVASVSYCAIVFSGDLERHLPTGIGIFLLSAAVIGIVTALMSSYPGSIGYAQSEPAVIVSIIAASMAAELGSAGNQEQILPTVLAAMAVGALVSGSFFIFLGTFRLGNLIRYIPFPVMGGFLAGIGWLLGQAALSSMAGERLSYANALDLLTPAIAVKWLPGVAAGVLLWLLQTHRRHTLNMPAVLGGATLMFWIVVSITGPPADALRAQGWLLGPFPATGLWTWHQPFDAFAGAAWGIFPAHIGQFLSLAILTAIGALLNASALEITTRRDLDLNRELRVIGFANIMAGAVGGHPGYHSMSGSVLTYRMNVPVRWVGAITALVCFGTLLVGASVLALIPKLVVGALLTFLALGFLSDWLYLTWRRMGSADYGVLLLVFLTVVLAGFMEAIVIGTAAGVVLFVVRYSSIGVARNVLSGATYHSNVDRSESYRSLLQQKGDEIFILKLQGFMFFGTSNRLVLIARERLDDKKRPPLRYLICDFRLVNGIDASAAASFIKLAQYAEERDFSLVLAGMPESVAALLRRERVDEGTMPRVRTFADLDHSLEWAEEDLLMRAGTIGLRLADSFDQQVRGLFPEADAAARFKRYFALTTYPPATKIIAQGARSDDILFIESGQVAIIRELGNAQSVRLKSMGAGTVVGEIAFYMGGARSASVVTLEATVAHVLSGDALRAMQRDDPALATAFHAHMARALSAKLIETNRLLDNLNQ